ncbi:MAG: hypothetical protein MNSN_03210 [Minisyncoccus archaeiphilus]|uniref:hypothetical protein n=1 Tax=Minisyncoccus archaeiphilus TaxID=3238481 RepID=UPI0009D36464|nr:MAG: hypothetical protein BWY21_00675 [Parcubacteria group bacterium ADurb.Bin216]GMX59322.1 MAG: hypothetical protein MNSN_03210 [Candidatus Parcubacteria bacterium]
MQHIWSVLCQRSSIDFETNLVSLFECIEEINLVFNNTKDANNEKIVIPVNWQLVNYWIVDGGEGSLEIKIDFVNPEGNVFSSYENKIELQNNIKRFRSRTNINGFEVAKSGRYKLVISYKKEGEYVKVSEIPVDINISFNLPAEGAIGEGNN